MKDLNKKITDFHYGRFSFFIAAVFILPSIVYYAVISIKNFLYKTGLLKEKKTDIKVICVGNLTTGGVGKTPVVIEIANHFSNMNKKTVILSRGYKGKLNNKNVNLIKTYDEILTDDPFLSGDEVNLIAHKTKNAAVITCADRVKGAKFAKEKLNAEILIMDDGFSNRKIYKDLNIILVDSKKMFGNNFVLPLGPLREPVCEIKRADKIIIVNKENDSHSAAEEFIQKFKIPYVNCNIIRDKIYNIKTNEPLTDKKPAVAFSGIGQPEQFFRSLSADFDIKETVSFDDHFSYDINTIKILNSKLSETGAQILLTTEKDAVKLLKFDEADKIYAVSIKADFFVDDICK